MRPTMLQGSDLWSQPGSREETERTEAGSRMSDRCVSAFYTVSQRGAAQSSQTQPIKHVREEPVYASGGCQGQKQEETRQLTHRWTP